MYGVSAEIGRFLAESGVDFWGIFFQKLDRCVDTRVFMCNKVSLQLCVNVFVEGESMFVDLSLREEKRGRKAVRTAGSLFV